MFETQPQELNFSSLPKFEKLKPQGICWLLNNNTKVSIFKPELILQTRLAMKIRLEDKEQV